ncbi:flavin reductase [Gaoshiqia sediminis]|uniref:Flavin reductase n=1 Tax=Gaoshiqia sediminis TaxID=2986998 RepID=A0AA41YBF8_9BACT|nr:flavin reductase [Gaoshiqia sediminis]MCW0482950.1 flavin reductase [Gaoshiqia sediminis]
MKLHAFHKLSYGLYLVASAFEGKKAGYIANTVFQVTSQPPLVAISCHKNNESASVIRHAGAFSISVLKKELDVKLIGDFGFMSGSDIDKFANRNLTTAKTGVPIVLDESVAWFDCEVKEVSDLGSHWLIIGEVVDSDLLLDEEPLTYADYREKYKMLSPKNSPTYLEREKLEAEKTVDSQLQAEAEEPVHVEGGPQKPEAAPRVCVICGYVYDPEKGNPTRDIPPGTPFEELPEDYRCPICNATKEYFKKI